MAKIRAYVEDSLLLGRLDERTEQLSKDMVEIKKLLSSFDAEAVAALLQAIRSEIKDHQSEVVTDGKRTP